MPLIEDIDKLSAILGAVIKSENKAVYEVIKMILREDVYIDMYKYIDMYVGLFSIRYEYPVY